MKRRGGMNKRERERGGGEEKLPKRNEKLILEIKRENEEEE